MNTSGEIGDTLARLLMVGMIAETTSVLFDSFFPTACFMIFYAGFTGWKIIDAIMYVSKTHEIDLIFGRLVREPRKKSDDVPLAPLRGNDDGEDIRMSLLWRQ